MGAAGPVGDAVLIGTGVNATQRIVRKAGEELGIIEEEKEPLKELLAELSVHVREIRDAVIKGGEKGDLSVLETIPAFGTGNTIQLRRKGRAYVCIFVVAATQVVFNVFALGQYLVTLQPGWSFTAMPDETELYMQNGQLPTNCYILTTDEQIGVAV